MIPGLPFDVFDQIVARFDPSEIVCRRDTYNTCREFVAWRDNINHFMLVSKAWHEAFAPFPRKMFFDLGKNSPVQEWLRQLLIDPASSDEITSVSLMYREDFGPCLDDTYGRTLVAEAFKVQDKIPYEPLEYWGAENALCIALLRNLRNLQLQTGRHGTEGIHFVIRLFERASRDASLLLNLRNLAIRQRQRHANSLQESPGLQHVFTLPHVERFEFAGFWEPLLFNLNNTSNIQHLKLSPWHGGVQMFRSIMNAIKQLKPFELMFFHGPWWVPNQVHIELIPGFFKHRDSLKSIIIRGMSPRALYDEHYPTLPIGSFKDFSALKELELLDTFLVGQARFVKANQYEEQPYLDDLFEAELKKYVRRAIKQRQLAESVPTHDVRFGCPADWQALTDIFPEHLEKLVFRVLPSQPLQYPRRHLLAAWYREFNAKKQARLPHLKGALMRGYMPCPEPELDPRVIGHK